jgi:hypothetical protein
MRIHLGFDTKGTAVEVLTYADRYAVAILLVGLARLLIPHAVLLASLALVLHGSAPSERAQLLRGFADCFSCRLCLLIRARTVMPSRQRAAPRLRCRP